MASNKSSITPMMAQYLEIKAQYPQAILFYRMGDFYEMFFDDAVAGAKALDIALTKRGMYMGKEIPMCGVPFHASENYLLTLIRKGFHVAVCEQLENPAEAKKRGSKSVVKRGVVRLVTPGTLTEDSLLSAREHNFLGSYAKIRDTYAFAWVDMSTGDFNVQPCLPINFSPMLARLNPAEILITEDQYEEIAPITGETKTTLTTLSAASFDSTAAIERLHKLFQVQSLDGFGGFDRADLAAMGAIIDYLDITQRGKLPLIKPPIKEQNNTFMHIDAATRRNLELTHTLSGEKKGSLLDTIDHTITSGGARLLETRLSNPSTQPEIINERLLSIKELKENNSMRDEMRNLLQHVPDLERALSRLSLERGGPRDLLAIRQALSQAEKLYSLLENITAGNLCAARNKLNKNNDIIDLLFKTLNNDVPILARDGGFVAQGYDADLDRARNLRDQGKKIIAEMQADYIKKTNISSLKIKHNNVLGYFIETTATHAKYMLSESLSNLFIHRQTTANAVRFTTQELSETETNILNAGGEAQAIELKIFQKLCDTILKQAPDISNTAKALADLDVSAALADIATAKNWCYPIISTERRFKITKGRHPIVEHALSKNGSTKFIANNCNLSVNNDNNTPIWLLTGPNMAGKSTFLRQNALITLLAQIGSYVPAAQAEIGIVSQLFSRVGASDDLARGRSTFMVEMVETAAILNQADKNALVILDEIGRGTATYDGLSIAWATLEHLHNVNQCRTLFATHYHELTQLSLTLKGLTNATVSVKEWDGEIIFLHEVIKGTASRSYGVQVAKLAGLPADVINRATQVLDFLENTTQKNTPYENTKSLNDLPLFDTPIENPIDIKKSEIEEILKETHPDSLSPRDALNLIYKLKSHLN